MPEPRPATDPLDPKGLIREAFRIDGISASECRSIFVDWALSVEGDDMRPLIARLLDKHRDEPSDHPMRAVLTEGLTAPPRARRRGGRAARVTDT
jgi:hypothetical protein